MTYLVLRTLGALACFVVACLASLFAWMGAGARTDDRGQIAKISGYSRALLEQIELARKQQGKHSEELEGAAFQLFQRAPLHDAPLALVGLLAAEAGQRDLADRAFHSAFSRNPRNVLALAWLADRAIVSGRAEEAIERLSGLLNLAPDQGKVYSEAMVFVTRLPGGLAAIERRMRRDGKPPPWASSVVSDINALWPIAEQLEGLNRITPSTQESFVARVIAERDILAGFKVWRSLIPDGPDEPISWPYDSRFQGKPGPPPFNWRTNGSVVGSSAGGGLYASYPGRSRQLLVEQTILLNAGDYGFAVQMSGEFRTGGGGFSWTIACSPSEAVLGRIVIREEPAVATATGFTFGVPERDCRSQQLSLYGEPGEFPLRARASVASVSISPLRRGN